MALDNMNLAYFWGFNSSGQAGNGTSFNTYTTPTAPIGPFTRIASGDFTTFATKN